MEMEQFLVQGSELETRIGRVYEKLATLTMDESKAGMLAKLAKEEFNHSSALLMGRNFLKGMPDLFLTTNLEDDDLKSGLDDLARLEDRLKGNLSLSDALPWLLALEKKFERIHIGASVKFGDPSLKNLFQSLGQGDHNHIVLLSQMISSLA